MGYNLEKRLARLDKLMQEFVEEFDADLVAASLGAAFRSKHDKLVAGGYNDEAPVYDEYAKDLLC